MWVLLLVLVSKIEELGHTAVGADETLCAMRARDVYALHREHCSLARARFAHSTETANKSPGHGIVSCPPYSPHVLGYY